MSERILPNLVTKEYRTLSRIAGPLLFIDRTQEIAFNEIVEITGPDCSIRLAHSHVSFALLLKERPIRNRMHHSFKTIKFRNSLSAVMA